MVEVVVFCAALVGIGFSIPAAQAITDENLTAVQLEMMSVPQLESFRKHLAHQLSQMPVPAGQVPVTLPFLMWQSLIAMHA